MADWDEKVKEYAGKKIGIYVEVEWSSKATWKKPLAVARDFVQNIETKDNEARTFIQRYFEEYPEIKMYMDNVVEDCKKNGYVSTLLNRKRYIPTINDRNFVVREQAKRFAMNSPIQGTAADIMKIAMVAVDKKIKDMNLKSKIVLQVHDELLIEAHESEVDKVKEILKYEMEHAAQISVPLDVDMHTGKNWYEAK